VTFYVFFIILHRILSSYDFFAIAISFKLVNEAEELLPGVTKDTLAKTEHKWLRGKMSVKERQKVIDYYSKRYGEKGEY